MSQNKNALIRYKTIDKCLQNQYRTWTLEDLIEACSEALFEYEGKENSVSKRTVQMDIQLMRSEIGEPPRATFFVSGPSRTADIEQTIVIGAHGPYRVHVVLIP